MVRGRNLLVVRLVCPVMASAIDAPIVRASGCPARAHAARCLRPVRPGHCSAPLHREACTITPADSQCASQRAEPESVPEPEPEPPPRRYVDFRDLARGGGGGGGPELGANFKCAAHGWDRSDCCAAQRSCRACTGCGAGCVWCTSPWGDSHCFDDGLDAHWPEVRSCAGRPSQSSACVESARDSLSTCGAAGRPVLVARALLRGAGDADAQRGRLRGLRGRAEPAAGLPLAVDRRCGAGLAGSPHQAMVRAPTLPPGD